ncbi:DUF1422 family protein [Shewanella gelidii]|uniref:Membrane protein n=1 Tax=Shewanella gelidii TaxID=1642821 RepID=A0A917JNH2_9GAMM|nr:DUF1422 family protein [Shewanella gelidii]MCL1097477.1 DUF1422 family protein [Shewanella gelidii]GGI75532.1 membrane protein [Shewanella gelidii]
MSQTSIPSKLLASTFVLGLSVNACFSALAISHVPFSVFPFLTIYFVATYFYKNYIEAQDPLPLAPAWAAFFLGLFSYSASLGAQYPENGSNIISIAFTAVLAIWLVYKLMVNKKQA